MMLSTPPSADLRADVSGPQISSEPQQSGFSEARLVTLRASVLGVIFAASLAGLHCFVETAFTVSFLGGIHLPFGAVFALFLLIGANVLLKKMSGRWSQPFSSTELLVVYVLSMFGLLVGTTGTSNFFFISGAGLFYFASAANRWAEIFYQFVPPSWAPGWDGARYEREVVDSFYLGGVSFSQIPWHAWVAPITAWGCLLLLCYGLLFSVSLLLRRQWIESEALSFPLLQLPLQMVESDGKTAPPARDFWTNKLLWMGFALAFALHFLRGMNAINPDWPLIASFQGNSVALLFTERPMNSIGSVSADIWLGAIGLAYLLTREMSLSLWVAFWVFKMQLVGATMVGYPAESLPKDTYLGRPNFVVYESIGAWLAMGALLLWSAREPIRQIFRAALRARKIEGEPFSPRFVVGLALFCTLGIGAWCAVAGVSPLPAFFFFAIYIGASLILARLVVEAGFLFPQLTFAPLEWMSTSVLGTKIIGESSLVKLAMVQPVIFTDARANLLPAYFHAFKVAHEQKLDVRQTRRLCAAIGVAIVLALAVTIATSLATFYGRGALTGYPWFTKEAPGVIWGGAAQMLTQQNGISLANWGWMGVGGAFVLLMTTLRARFFWFPLHPLPFLIAPGYQLERLWFSIFLGWLFKTLIGKFGGTSQVVAFRPFMIGLILGNALAMILWLIIGAFNGTILQYWTA